MKPLLVLQHIACEPPAAYEDELRAWGGDLHRVEIDAGDELPDWRAFAGIVAMGGPMGAYEERRLPWLAQEKRLIADAVRAGVPYWGVCLGAQLLAGSLGADVCAGPRAEVGILPVCTTPAAATDPVFRHAPAEFPALQWHSDTFELPSGAVLLASSSAYAHQAFVVDRAYGLQFHIEIDGDVAAEWGTVPAYARSLSELLGDDALPRLVGALRGCQADMIRLARALFAAWLEHVVGWPRPARSADPARDAQPL